VLVEKYRHVIHYERQFLDISSYVLWTFQDKNHTPLLAGFARRHGNLNASHFHCSRTAPAMHKGFAHFFPSDHQDAHGLFLVDIVLQARAARR